MAKVAAAAAAAVLVIVVMVVAVIKNKLEKISFVKLSRLELLAQIYICKIGVSRVHWNYTYIFAKVG